MSIHERPLIGSTKSRSVTPSETRRRGRYGSDKISYRDDLDDSFEYSTSTKGSFRATKTGTYQHVHGEKSPQRSKVSIRELFKFATFADKLLMIFGAIFAIINGAGPAFIALVFGDMTNVLVRKVQSDFVASATAANGSNVIATTTIKPIVETEASENDTSNFTTSTPVVSHIDESLESTMARFSLYYVGIAFMIYLASLVQITCWQTTCERQSHRIRRAFFRATLRQELAWFDCNQAGELSAKLNDDIELIRSGTGEQFGAILQHFSGFLAGFVVGFIASWRLTLVILGATPLLAMFSAYLGKLLTSSNKREQEKYASAGALAEEVLTTVRTVFALGGQRYEIKRYKKKLEEGEKIAKWKYLKLSVCLAASMLVLYSTYGLALYVGSRLMANGMISAGDSMTVIMAVMMAASALGNTVPPIQAISMAFSSATLIFDIIDSVPGIDASNERGLKLSKVTANVKFENVIFSYPSRKSIPVLKNLNFELNQGQTVAICGRTGSGKSTIMNLLLRFYDPDEGAIYLDNCNLCDLNVSWLRSLIGIVEQEPALFDCSIFDNIALGAVHESDRTYDRVIEAAKLANAHDFVVNLPDGYNTRCGDRGVHMSGGQKQRIAIARALLCDPKILLLDEATSALDSGSEFIVQSALNKARQGRTAIIIAHRLSTIREADMICVMSNGSIIERGRHEDLMDLRGEYYNLVTNQVFNDERTDSVDNGDNLSLTDEMDSDTNQPAFTKSASLFMDRSSATHLVQTTDTTKEYVKRKYSTTLYESTNRPIKSWAEFQRADSVKMPSWLDIYNLVKFERNRLILATIMSIFSGALLPTFALFYAQIFDTFTKTGQQLLDSGSFWSLMFIVLAVANFITWFTRIFFMATAVESVMARIRAECYTVILRQHVGWFDSEVNSPQRLSTRLASDVPKIKAVVNTRFTALLAGFATIVAAVIIALSLSWKMAIIMVIALPMLLYIGYLKIVMTRGDQAQQVKRLENASRLATEAIEHVKLIQSINKERYFYDRFNEELKDAFKGSIKSARSLGLMYGLSQSFIYFLYAASFRWAAFLMARGEIDPITMFRVFFSIAMTAVSVGQWGGIGGDLSSANFAIALVIRLLATQPAIDNLSRGGIKPKFKGSITFQDVHFRYPTRPNVPVLQGLSLSLKPGQTLALVGPSGNGKSTIASLLLRFYDPDRGVVRIDNYDIRCINLNYLRFNIGLVSQEPCLFKASIKENILYGLDKSRYSMREVVEAAKLANIDDFITSLPDGYNTQVGDRGTKISGGQKQRIAIARTMIRNPSILILDEATSALDSESEALVNQALEKASKGKTCIKIAHRLSTVRDADQIAVIEKGSIVELGTHDELMSLGKRGYYYKLMQKQDISS